MIMIKALLRFSLLLALCALFVYAPEILSSVSAPYSLSAPERVLLRIAMCYDSETSALLHDAISAYQKQYPFVHLRVTHISEEQLHQVSSPYPDVVLCPLALAVQLPSGFAPTAQASPADHTLLCAVSPDSHADAAAAELAAYIDEALAQQDPPS